MYLNKAIHIRLFLALSLITVVALLSCEHDAELPVHVEGTDSVICFDSQVLPIVSSYCGKSGCHDGFHEFSLLSYQEIRNKVKPGDPLKSELYKAIVPNKWLKNTYMPPSPDIPLSNAQITAIQLWIMEGANPTSCGK